LIHLGKENTRLQEQRDEKYLNLYYISSELHTVGNDLLEATRNQSYDQFVASEDRWAHMSTRFTELPLEL